MGNRSARRKPVRKAIPLWVLFGISLRAGQGYGGPMPRRQARFHMILIASTGAVFIAGSPFIARPIGIMTFCCGTAALLMAMWSWLAIRWLDRRKAWRWTRRPDGIYDFPRLQ